MNNSLWNNNRTHLAPGTRQVSITASQLSKNLSPNAAFAFCLPSPSVASVHQCKPLSLKKLCPQRSGFRVSLIPLANADCISFLSAFPFKRICVRSLCNSKQTTYWMHLTVRRISLLGTHFIWKYKCMCLMHEYRDKKMLVHNLTAFSSTLLWYLNCVGFHKLSTTTSSKKICTEEVIGYTHESKSPFTNTASNKVTT